MKDLCCVLTALAVFALLEAAHLEHERRAVADKATRILMAVPSTQKNEFIRYHFQKGYELTQKEVNEKYPEFSINITDSGSKVIYEYFSQNHLVEDEDVIKVARTIICWGDKCIDFSDPGVHPN